MTDALLPCPAALIALELQFVEMAKDEAACTCGSEEGNGCYIHDGMALLSRLRAALTTRPTVSAPVSATEQTITCETCEGTGHVDMSLGDANGVHSDKDAMCPACYGKGSYATPTQPATGRPTPPEGKGPRVSTVRSDSAYVKYTIALESYCTRLEAEGKVMALGLKNSMFYCQSCEVSGPCAGQCAGYHDYAVAVKLSREK